MKDLDIIPIDEFKDYVETGFFTNYDGYGQAYDVDRKVAYGPIISPSTVHLIPDTVTHIDWTNK